MPERIVTYSGLLVAAAALVVGVPLFLRMPPWCDLTLYDLAAQNLLRGGVHYRDVFDTNLPGFVWALAAVQAVLGRSTEAVRAVDLVVVAGIAVLLDRFAAWGGASRGARAWLLAGIALFYPYTSEFNHAQRDIWMLLPALAAVAWRCRATDFPFRAAVGQGVLWGLAIWVKPHVLPVVVAVWACTLPVLVARGWRVAARDAGGLILGGGVTGATGVAVLFGTGTWPHFVEVFTFWNTSYVAVMRQEFDSRLTTHLLYFPPWGYLQFLTIPLACGNVVVGLVAACRGPVSPTRYARLLLSALYLSWTAQAVLIQRGFHYAHVDEILLLLALGAAHRLYLGAATAAVLTVTSLLILDARVPMQNPNPALIWPSDPHVLFVRHPLFDGERMALWPHCFRTGLSDEAYYQRQNDLAQVREFFPANDWVQLAELAAELKRRGARDGEVLAWDDAPHAVYRLAGIRPGFRFLHVRAMTGLGPAQAQRIRAERDAATKVKYAIGDLKPLGFSDPTEVGDRAAFGPDLLPPSLSDAVRKTYPYTLPAVFRTRQNTGRYVLYAVRPE